MITSKKNLIKTVTMNTTCCCVIHRLEGDCCHVNISEINFMYHK
jgi:hypothetical protein